MTTVTAIVTTFNSADVIEACLRSLLWADEIIVVDSGSTDQTLAIAASIPVQVLQHPYENPVAQKNWSIAQAKSEWILWIDSDERLSNALQQEISRVIKVFPSHYAGYKIPRLNYVFGKPVRYAHYYPDYQLRLFKRDAWFIEDHVQIHEHIQLHGNCSTITNPILHLAHRTVDQTTAVLLIRWTTFEAQQRYSLGVRFSVWQMVGRTIAAFFLRYIVQQGFRDGLRGLFVSGYWGIYLFMVYLKLWEFDHKSELDSMTLADGSSGSSNNESTELPSILNNRIQ